jgi:MerR family transcriptional regulator, light-induced transcriptional regulator
MHYAPAMTDSKDVTGERATLRIGELSRRVGVSDHLLRAWERRYGLLRPGRSEGGYRLYTAADEQRVRRMLGLIDEGLSPAEAARVAGSDAPPGGVTAPLATADLGALARQLEESLDMMDEPTAQSVLDRLFSDLTVEAVLRDVLVPYLQRLGARWAAGEVSVAQEHFASGVVRGRLLGLARGWGRGLGPHALLACPPGERHDLGLLMFGIVLHRGGWRVGYFGVDTPLEDLLPVARAAEPDLIVLAASDPAHFRPWSATIGELGAVAPLLLGGEGARHLADTFNATRPPEVLTENPVTAAERLTAARLRSRPEETVMHESEGDTTR